MSESPEISTLPFMQTAALEKLVPKSTPIFMFHFCNPTLACAALGVDTLEIQDFSHKESDVKTS